MPIREKDWKSMDRIFRKVYGVFAGVLLFAGGPLPAGAATAQANVAPSLRWDEARTLSRWVIPAQSLGWVGVQGREREKPMTVTPGNRFLEILGNHAHWYFDRRNHLALSERQKHRIVRLLIRTRDRLVRLDARDLFLVQRFEAAVASPSVDIAELGRLNERIGAVEGEEAGVFVGALGSLQKVLLPDQRRIAVAMGHDTIPPLSVDLSGAVFFADRILSIRWNLLQNAMSSGGKEEKSRALAAYEKGRKEILSLGTEKTVWDKKAGDLMSQPFVDLDALGAVEKKGGPVEARFWETFIKVVGTLNPASVR